MLKKPSYCYSHVFFPRSWRDTSAHAQRNHLTTERCRFTARLLHRAGHRLSPWGTVSYRAPVVCHTRTERWKQQSRCVEVCARCISTSKAACGGLSAALWLAPSLHGSSRECHENQKSWLRDRCSSLSKTRRRRQRREMETVRKIRIR